MTVQRLVFIHLSDIHFKGSINGTKFDLDLQLRNEIERDILDKIGTLGGVTGILVTGDIAFKGNHEDYQSAHTWLENLCDTIECSPENVWVVPGNHDVDRDIINNSKMIRTFHKTLRECSINTINQELTEFLKDQPGAELFLTPMQNYNKFASSYQCQITLENPYWEHKILLNDGSNLYLRGLTSTLISDQEDDHGAGQLVLGEFQTTMIRDPSVTYLIMCHHPPSWLRDEDHVNPKLINYAKIHLFGHKHNQTILKIEDSIQLVSGAVHPDRQENEWLPRYNIIEISVIRNQTGRFLKVNVHPRIWIPNDQSFGIAPEAGENGFINYQLHIENWNPINMEKNGLIIKEDDVMPEKSPSSGKEKPQPEESIKSGNDAQESPSTVNPGINPYRSLVYRYLSLAVGSRIDIARKLNLIEDKDEGITDKELYLKIFKRAKERELLADLWYEVRMIDETILGDNPFRTK